MVRGLLIGSAVAVAVFLTWLAWAELRYLLHGYSIQVKLAEEANSIYHIDFPAWRISVCGLPWAAAMAVILAYIRARAWAPTAAWPTLVTTVAVGMYDIYQYGTIGSPTTIWTVLLVLLVAILATYRLPFPTSDP